MRLHCIFKTIFLQIRFLLYLEPTFSLYRGPKFMTFSPTSCPCSERYCRLISQNAENCWIYIWFFYWKKCHKWFLWQNIFYWLNKVKIEMMFKQSFVKGCNTSELVNFFPLFFFAVLLLFIYLFETNDTISHCKWYYQQYLEWKLDPFTWISEFLSIQYITLTLIDIELSSCYGFHKCV